MNCKHKTFVENEIRPFAGSVSIDENRRAHGNVTVTEECTACGARRTVNVNQQHREEGPWGPSRIERMTRAAELQAKIPLRPLAETVMDGGESAYIYCDRQGFIIVADGPSRLAELYPHLDEARAYRKAWLAWYEAALEI